MNERRKEGCEGRKGGKGRKERWEGRNEIHERKGKRREERQR